MTNKKYKFLMVTRWISLIIGVIATIAALISVAFFLDPAGMFISFIVATITLCYGMSPIDMPAEYYYTD
jgi:purine-cytosine permease-like protein